MNSKYWIWMSIMGLLGLFGCDDKEALVPSGTLVPEIVLPQGTHDYDTKIVDFYTNTGVYILYKFNPKDIYFAGNLEWTEIYHDTLVVTTTLQLGENLYVKDGFVYQTMLGSVTDSWKIGTTYMDNGLWERVTVNEEIQSVYIETQQVSIKGVISVLEADEAYVGQQLAWVEKMFLNFYPVAVLKEALPLKLILGKEVTRYPLGSEVGWISQNEILFSYNSLIFSRGNNSLETLTPEQEVKIKSNLNTWFLTERLASMVSFDKFYAKTNYHWVGGSFASIPKADQCYALGLIKVPASTILSSCQSDDLKSYIKMITGNSYEKLTAEPVNGNFSDTDYTGILHKHSLIREKYDVLVNEFRQLGIDIQAIGNAVR